MLAASEPRIVRPGLYTERYELIDGWRGLAALAVCVHHVTTVRIGGPAVMVFFVLSGYCIAASADACQRKGWGFREFMWRRIRRIYPPYLFSIAFWAATRVVKWQLAGGPNDLAVRPTGEPRGWIDWLQNLTLTQWLSMPWLQPPLSHPASNDTLFVAAYWSLCYEEQFYLVVGLMIVLAGLVGVSVLAMSLGLLAVSVAWNVRFPTTSFGVFIEYWTVFVVGVLVFYRLCRIERASVRKLIDATFATGVAIAVYMRWFSGHDWPTAVDHTELFRNAYSDLATALSFGLLLIVMRPFSERIAAKGLFRPLSALGLITFSLYLIHEFNLRLMAVAAHKLIAPLSRLPMPEADVHGGWSYVSHSDVRMVYPAVWLWAWIGLQLVGHIALATVFWCFCEKPFLNKAIPGGTTSS